jgi:WD40 repeat protein
MRRNFRVSPMPLSALSVIRTDLLAIGGHDNAITLYSSACGSAVAKCQVHADTVTCLGVSASGTTLVSGSSDQSVRTWQVTPSSLRNESTFDDIQQPITCVASGRSLYIAGADDGQLLAWDARSGQAVLDRELAGAAVACALHEDERFAAALDACGELRLWDLRQRCENLKLTVAGGIGCDLKEASCFLTDFAGWVMLGGTSILNGPAVTLWDVPEQRALRTWAPPEALGVTGGPGVKYFVALSGFRGATRTGPSLLSASANGALHVFGRNVQ